MVGAISGERPLEQVADFCPYGWGGSVYQLAADRRTLNILAMYGGCLSLAQSNWHPRRGELYAQREVRASARRDLGRLPAICWTDHSASVKDASGEGPAADATIIRWVGEIESDGSRLKNLSGRSAALGDGPSRCRPEHGRFLREQCHSLSGITLDDLVGDQARPGEPVAWGLDITPDAAAVRPSAPALRGDALLVLYLPDYASSRRRALSQQAVERQLLWAFPQISFSIAVHDPPLEDGSGGKMYISPPKFGSTDAKTARKLRNDVLSSVASVLRDAQPTSPRLLIGAGHGGLVAMCLAHPRLVEAALSLRYAREAEGQLLSET